MITITGKNVVQALIVNYDGTGIMTEDIFHQVVPFLQLVEHLVAFFNFGSQFQVAGLYSGAHAFQMSELGSLW